MTFEEAVAGAVRAELARFEKKPNDLCEVLGLSRSTVTGRLSGAYPFTTAEIRKVATFLGITPHDLMLSAALTEKFGADRSEEITPLAAPVRDAWAQPPGSLRRRRS